MSTGEEMQLGLTSFEETKQKCPSSKDTAANAMVQPGRATYRGGGGRDMPNARVGNLWPVFDEQGGKRLLQYWCWQSRCLHRHLPITKGKPGWRRCWGMNRPRGGAAWWRTYERGDGDSRRQESLGLGLQKTDPKWRAAAALAYGYGTKLGAELPAQSPRRRNRRRIIGLIYIARARRLSARSSGGFWKQFGNSTKQQGSDTPWFLRTHPLDETRVNNCRAGFPKRRRRREAIREIWRFRCATPPFGC